MITRDINFFAPYVKEEERSVAQLVLTATAVVVMVGISGTLGYNAFQLNAINEDIKIVTDELASKDFIKKHKEAKLVILEKDLLQGFNTTLMTVHDGIIDRSMIDTEIIKQISTTIPKAANLKSLQIEGGTIVMNVVAGSENDAADMQFKLNKLPIIKSTFIPGVNPDFADGDEEVNFSITCVLEEGYYEN
ncbi:MAG: PilN domain-containing protein [Sarcina sp.]